MPASACPPLLRRSRPAAARRRGRAGAASVRPGSPAASSFGQVSSPRPVATPSSSPRPRHRHALVIATPSSSPRPRHRRALVIAAPSFFRGDSRTRSGVRNRFRRAAQGRFILLDLRLRERSPRPDRRRMGRRIRTVGPDSPAIVFAGRIRHSSRMQNGMTPARGGRDVSFCSTSGSGNGRHVPIGAAWAVESAPSAPIRPRSSSQAHPTPVPDAEWNDPGARRQGRFILLDLRLQERSPRPDRRRTWAVESAPSAPIRPRSSSQGASDTRPGCRME